MNGPENYCAALWHSLWHGLHFVVARSPDRATPRGDLRSVEWHGRETVPQRVANRALRHCAIEAGLPQVAAKTRHRA
jgi:hypothetical protein